MAAQAAPPQGVTVAQTPGPCVQVTKQPHFAQYARGVYKRSVVTLTARRRFVKLIRCGLTPEARKNMRALRRKLKEKRAVRLEAPKPVNGWAIPAYIVMCESGGSYTAQNPSGAYGAYQLMPGWWAHLGRKPTPREQDQIAARLWAGGRGASHWVCA